MSVRIFSAAETQALDLFSHQVPTLKPETRIEAEIAAYLTVAERAVAASKAQASALEPKIHHAVINDKVKRLADTWESVEAIARIDAFLKKYSALGLIYRSTGSPLGTVSGTPEGRFKAVFPVSACIKAIRSFTS